MSIPYESDTTAAAAIVPTDAWVEYPFSERLDNTTVEYKIKCSCKRENYSAPAFTAVMDTAENFSSDEGELITFTRIFGTKPINVTYMESSYTYTFPEFRSWFDNFYENIKYYQAPNVFRKSISKTVAAKTTYSYHLSSSGSVYVAPSTYYYDLGAGGASGGKANYVADSVYDKINFPGTSPSRSTYVNYINNGTYIVAESNVRHYKGNIFEKKTVEVKAQ
jgi:hypothetical protein